MSLVVIGSIAFDTVRTPFGERERMLGGSAVHFALAARMFSEVHIVGPVGDDFGEEQLDLLRERGVDVDVLSATVPPDYQADAFIAIHADGDVRGALRGYKIARSPMSQIPAWDDALVDWLYAEYGRVTGLPRDDEHISRRMLFYYAFNNRRYAYAIAPSTPAAIVEAGFMTSAADRALLVGASDRAAAGLAAGILGFLGLDLRTNE
jgi:sugar/nucleoside kinase (ribokinase family)